MEVIADGPEAALLELEHALQRGPSSAHVERVEKFDVPHEVMIPKTFDIS